MSKTIYYIGAGASYGKRNENGDVVEGIPVVAEIAREVVVFREYIAKAEIPQGDVLFQDTYLADSEQVEMEKRRLLMDIDSILDGVQEHATIDTYARKLYLTKDTRMFNLLKDVLCAFFIWAQLDRKPDNRYDTFFANILQEDTMSLPKEISIISWNYDSQLEIAYKAYQSNKSLPIFEKHLQGEWLNMPNSGRIFKVNGSATFFDSTIVPLIKEYTRTSPAVQLIMFYNNVKTDTTELGFQEKTHLSFAWEESSNVSKMREAIRATTTDTEQVVVIGYSFPFFNRLADREFFSNMVCLKKIYIQDIHANEVEQSIQAVLPEGKNIEIVKIPNCSQFYLPKEL